MTNQTNTTKPAVVKIGHGLELHLALATTSRPTAYCKGLRAHRAFKVSADLSTISCAKCRAKAVHLGLLPA
jgi:hypothetical protein